MTPPGAHDRREPDGQYTAAPPSTGDARRPVTVRDLLDCPDCIEATDGALISACASVGIEHGRSTGDMLRSYLAGWHRRGHPETQ